MKTEVKLIIKTLFKNYELFLILDFIRCIHITFSIIVLKKIIFVGKEALKRIKFIYLFFP